MFCNQLVQVIGSTVDSSSVNKQEADKTGAEGCGSEEDEESKLEL